MSGSCRGARRSGYGSGKGMIIPISRAAAFRPSSSEPRVGFAASTRSTNPSATAKATRSWNVCAATSYTAGSTPGCPSSPPAAASGAIVLPRVLGQYHRRGPASPHAEPVQRRGLRVGRPHPAGPGDEPLGLLQLNDRRKGRFTPELIRLLERLCVRHGHRTGPSQGHCRSRESETKYRTIADFTYDWEYWRAPDGKLLYTSPACERFTGYRPEEFQADPGLLRTIVTRTTAAGWGVTSAIQCNTPLRVRSTSALSPAAARCGGSGIGAGRFTTSTATFLACSPLTGRSPTANRPRRDCGRA